MLQALLACSQVPQLLGSRAAGAASIAAACMPAAGGRWLGITPSGASAASTQGPQSAGGEASSAAAGVHRMPQSLQHGPATSQLMFAAYASTAPLERPARSLLQFRSQLGWLLHHSSRPALRQFSSSELPLGNLTDHGTPASELLPALKPDAKSGQAACLLSAQEASAVLEVVEDDRHGYSRGEFEQEVLHSAVWKLASIGSQMQPEEVEAAVTSAPAFHRLTSMLVLGAPRFSGPELVSMLLCLGVLRYQEPVAIDTLVSAAIEAVDELSARDLVLMVKALHEMGGAPNVVVLDVIRTRLEGLPQDQVNSSAREFVEEGLKKLGHTDASPSQELPPQQPQTDRAASYL